MRRLHVFAVAVIASSAIVVGVAGQGQKPTAPVFEPTTGDYEKADIRVLTPGVVFMSGLPDLAAAFSKEAGKTVGINTVGMGTIIDDMFKRPEFAGINAPPSTKGEGGQALARGEGDMAIQTISQILPYKEIELVGPVPKEYGLWIDTMLAVSSRSTNPNDARALIRYLLRPESNKVWKPRGMERFE